MQNVENGDYDDTDKDEEAATSKSFRFEISNYPTDFTLRGYADLFKKQQLKTPEFQRNYVWKPVQSSRLIESFLLGLPVPPVFLYKGKNSKEYLIIDGVQRLTTIDKFLSEKSFALKGVDECWNGNGFNALSEEDRFKLENSPLRAIIIEQLSPNDNTSINHIFERLNTGGTALNAMEVRVCVSSGKFVEMLKSLNLNTIWRQLVSPKPHDRLQDVELILRVFALFDGLDKYEKPMKDFISAYLNDNKNQTDEWLNKRSELFIKAISLLGDQEKNPLKPSKKLNYAILDSICVGLMRVFNEGYEISSDEFSSAFDSIKNYTKVDAENDKSGYYLNLIQDSTSDKERVKERMSIVYGQLRAIKK